MSDVTTLVYYWQTNLEKPALIIDNAPDQKRQARAEVGGSDKHTSLLQLGIGYKDKKGFIEQALQLVFLKL